MGSLLANHGWSLGRTAGGRAGIQRKQGLVVTGDPGQVDLPKGQSSGLAHALRILRGVEGVGRVTFSARDVRRHALVSRIIQAYDNDSEQKRSD